MTDKARSKIRSRDQLVKLRTELKAQGKTVGFTSGVFDLLHPGHIAYLEEAKLHCDVLFVGVNSDSSVRANKGEGRPVCREGDRSLVAAALESVDYVFVFNEQNNNRNVELLTPDIYIKAGDYDKGSMTSAPLVEAYGGRILIMPFKQGHSSSELIRRIGELTGRLGVVELPIPPYEKRPAVFLDRDGTINECVEYLHEPEKFKVLPGVTGALKKLQDAGYRLVIVTNQPGIGMGYFPKEAFFSVNRAMYLALRPVQVAIDRIYYCPHTYADKCECRKPGTALFKRAIQELNIDVERSYMVGDMTSDVQAGREIGCRTILLRCGLGGKDGLFEVEPDHVAKDLAEAAEIVTGAMRPGSRNVSKAE